MNFFRRNKYNAPQPIDPPPVPTVEAPRRNGVFINESERSIQVIVYQNDQDSIPRALGALEMAKDVVKQQMSQWHARQARRSPILVPGNGNGKLHEV